MEITQYNNITRAKGIVTFMGIKMPPINIYLIDDLLIDTGPRSMADELIPFYKNSRISHVALTHLHEDHSGLAPWIQQNLHVPVYLHKDSIDRAAEPAHLPEYREKIWGPRDAFTAQPIPKAFQIERYCLNVIETPGHSPAHKVLYEAWHGLLFTGDLFVRVKQDVAFKSENITQAIETIENLLKLDFDTLLCFHSGIHENGKDLFSEKLDFFKELKEKVVKLRSQGLDDKEIDNKLYPVKHPITYLSNGEWSSLNMIKTL